MSKFLGNCDVYSLHLDDTIYVHVPKKYTPTTRVQYHCPARYEYRRHVCGNGANEWKGNNTAEYGPFSNNQYLEETKFCRGGCDCQDIAVECILIGTII